MKPGMRHLRVFDVRAHQLLCFGLNSGFCHGSLDIKSLPRLLDNKQDTARSKVLLAIADCSEVFR